MDLINSEFDVMFAGCCDPMECTCESCDIGYEKEFNKNFLMVVEMINRCDDFNWIEYIQCSRTGKRISEDRILKAFNTYGKY